jgi:hypothetical protein
MKLTRTERVLFVGIAWAMLGSAVYALWRVCELTAVWIAHAPGGTGGGL